MTQSPHTPQDPETPHWWEGTPRRLLQTNLREIDLPLDPEAYARAAEEFGANVALFNVGGIVANYPTRLPFHFRNPRLQHDLLGELIEQLHRRGIRLIGRFDFSKVNAVIGAQHPEWLYRDRAGDPVTYNGQMQCCVNGAYQQEASLAILAEALRMYPLDGVFFNMIGYQTHDYSGVNHGLCQCENCRREFFARYDEPLPASPPPAAALADAVYSHYLAFCEDTSRELFLRIRDHARAIRPECAICTYISDGIDIIRSEANSGIRRMQPEFVYDASLSVRRARGSWPGKAISNAAVHFIDFPYRHAGVSPALTARRIAQDFIHGGWLDYYVIGRLEEQHDRACQPEVRRLFALHRQAEPWLAAPTRPLADACLIEAGPANPNRNPDELRGLVSLLSEDHILYDVIQETALPEISEERLSGYPLVILPDLTGLPADQTARLERYVQRGGRLLLTGRACASPSGSPAFACAGLAALEPQPYEPGAYLALAAEEHARLPHLADVDWVPLDTAWMACTPAPEAQTLLRVVPVGMYGPPEKCYYTDITEFPGIIVHQAGAGLCVTLPWQPGSQYNKFPTHATAGLFRSVLDHVLALPRSIRVDAPPQVEVSAAVQTGPERALVLGFANLSGQNGRAIHAPLPVEGVRVVLPAQAGAHAVETLTRGALPAERLPDGSLSFRLPRLEAIELVRVQTRAAEQNGDITG